ncbi:MAG: hypothetical protein AAF810_15145 [Cyanobacteria bacterium P01_D01_bin.36]
MQSVYWFCLTIGGAFVALSLVGGGDLLDDVDIDADADFDIDADAGFDVDAGFDAEADADFDADVDADGDVQIDTDVELLHVARKRKQVPAWLSILMSFKFWTFGGFFFGLTGLVLGATNPELGVLIVAIALIMGIVCGGALVSALRFLKYRKVDSLVRNEDFSGLVGTVELPFDKNSKGKVFLEVGGSTLHLIARTDEAVNFQVGDRVLVVGRSQNRLWVVADKSK